MQDLLLTSKKIIQWSNLLQVLLGFKNIHSDSFTNGRPITGGKTNAAKGRHHSFSGMNLAFLLYQCYIAFKYQCTAVVTNNFYRIYVNVRS